ncbi:MAG: VOC family protein [Terriglobia bacterium]
MTQIIATMLKNYEHGKISRRRLIQGLAAIATAAYAAPAFSSTFQGVAINHIALRVTNVRRSRDFYQTHFGLPVIRESQSSCFLGIGENFLALFQSQKPGLDHYCLAIDNYKVDWVMEELKRQGFTPRRPSGTDRVYFPDPDGLVVQLSSLDHRP